MEIRHSTEKDLEKILSIYDFARKFMIESGNSNQWVSTNWSPKNLIENDILQKKSYICIHDEKICETFYYDFGEEIETTYKKIFQGEWKNNSAYGVVHRIASDGSVKGIGKFCLNWAFEKSKHLRIDTHGDNKIMQNLFKKLNF